MKIALIFLILGVSVQSLAIGRGGRITRGGFGFLFPDHNSFVNPGQFAVERGLAFEGKFEIESSTQTAVPSIVFGNGSFGIGLFAERTGESVLSGATSEDTMGGGVGVSLAKERLTIGVGISQPVEEGTGSTELQGTLTLNGAKRNGFTMGMGFATTLGQAGGDVRRGTVAMGYGSGGLSLEVVGGFKNLSDFGNMDLSVYLNWRSSAFYAATGYSHGLTERSSTLKGRLGVILAGFDVSGYASYPLQSTSSLSFGGSLRLAI